MSSPGSSIIASLADIVRHLRLEMPVVVKIHDPITSKECEINRDNLLGLLVVDAPNLAYDAQWLAALYMEMARARRACERASAVAERAFVKWKAQKAADARAAAAASGKKITVAEAEEAYRTHAEYEDRAGAQSYYATLASLFEDAMQAFQIKARMVDVVSRTMGGHGSIVRTEDRTEDIAKRAEDAIASTRTEDQQRKPRGF